MYPQPYIDYLVYFHGVRDYFECHEVLEEYWKEKESAERERHWVGFIQIAVALYHHRRGNFTGAEKMMKSAITILMDEKNRVTPLGLDYDKLIETLEGRLEEIHNHFPYHSLNLPVTDEQLLAICSEKCKEKGCSWGSQSDLSNQFLVHKHSVRDRRDVINERKRRLEEKKNKN